MPALIAAVIHRNVLLGHVRRHGALGIVQAGVAHMYRLNHRRSVPDDVEGLVGKAQRLAAALFGVALGNRCGGRLGNGAIHGHQPVAGIFHVGSHRIARNDLGVGLGGSVHIHRAQPLLDGARQASGHLELMGLAGIGIADAEQRLVALGVERVGIDHRLEAGDGCGVILAALVVEADLGLALGQNLLHVAQLLLGAGHQRRIREHD